MTTRSGYAVTIRGFIPTDPADIDGLAEVLAAIRDAKQVPSTDPTTVPVTIKREGYDDVEETLDISSSADDMFRLMEMELFEVRPVSRRAKAEGEAS